MGHGVWTKEDFRNYQVSRGRSVKKDGSLAGDYSAQEMYQNRSLSPLLDPKGVVRECCETEEHPNTVPVILALDVTGSMGASAVQVAKELNKIMTELYQQIEDVQFLIMGIGDFMYDRAPLQVSQFESDIRIAEQLDQLYFEAGGGGNSYESYSAAWYFAANHTRLDCWQRGRKGIIITIGDEPLNPYIPLQGNRVNFAAYMGDDLQGNVETGDIVREIADKYELYHIVVDHGSYSHHRISENVKSFARYLAKANIAVESVETLPAKVVGIIEDFVKNRDMPKQESIFSKAVKLVSW